MPDVPGGSDPENVLPPSLLTALKPPRSGVVVGPPGSGKTSIAVHLAEVASASLRTELVVASRHLVGWLKPRLQRGVAVLTWADWLTAAYAEGVGGKVPKKGLGGLPGIDWLAVLAGLEAAAPRADRQVVVDEAQDVPFRLIRAMRHYAVNVLAFADPLQRHVEDGSTVEQLVDALVLDDPWPVMVLEEDFRTTYEIQRLAVSAWAPERLDPSRPARKQGPLPRLVRGGFDTVAKEAKRLLEGNAGSVVIASSHADRAQIVTAARKLGLPIQSGSTAGGNAVRSLAFEALRGLEYQSVVLVPPTQLLGSWEETRADLYVATTRAMQNLSIVLTGAVPSEVEEALARDVRLINEVGAPS